MKRRLWTAAALLVFVIFVAFVWPTRYHYFELKRGEGVALVMRADRFSEKTWLLTPSGWKSNNLPPPVPDNLPPPEPMPIPPGATIGHP
jgi:hypothetical protein